MIFIGLYIYLIWKTALQRKYYNNGLYAGYSTLQLHHLYNKIVLGLTLTDIRTLKVPVLYAGEKITQYDVIALNYYESHKDW